MEKLMGKMDAFEAENTTAASTDRCLGEQQRGTLKKGIFRPKFGSYGFPKFLIHLVRVLILNLHPYDRSLLAKKT